MLLVLFTLCKAVSQADTVNDLLPRHRLRGEKRLWVVDGGYRGKDGREQLMRVLSAVTGGSGALFQANRKIKGQH